MILRPQDDEKTKPRTADVDSIYPLLADLAPADREADGRYEVAMGRHAFDNEPMCRGDRDVLG